MNRTVKLLGIIMIAALAGNAARAVGNAAGGTSQGGQRSTAGQGKASTVNVFGGSGGKVVLPPATPNGVSISGFGGAFSAGVGNLSNMANSACGEIKSVGTDSVTVALNGNGSKPGVAEMKFLVSGKTRVSINGEQAKSDKLFEGMKIAITYRKNDSGAVADSISAYMYVFGIIRSVGEDSFVIVLSVQDLRARETNPGKEPQKKEWTVFVDNHTKKVDLAQGAEAIGAFTLSALHKDDIVQVWYSKREKKDDAGNVSITAVKVFPQKGRVIQQ